MLSKQTSKSLINLSLGKLRIIANQLFFKINEKAISYNDEVSEYDIQEELYNILRFKFANQEIETKREKAKLY